MWSSVNKRQFYDCIISLYTLQLQLHFPLPRVIDCDFQELALGIWASYTVNINAIKKMFFFQLCVHVFKYILTFLISFNLNCQISYPPRLACVILGGILPTAVVSLISQN